MCRNIDVFDKFIAITVHCKIIEWLYLSLKKNVVSIIDFLLHTFSSYLAIIHINYNYLMLYHNKLK